MRGLGRKERRERGRDGGSRMGSKAIIYLGREGGKEGGMEGGKEGGRRKGGREEERGWGWGVVKCIAKQ